MDTYVEHLIPMKKDKKIVALLIFIIVFLIAISVLSFYLAGIYGIFVTAGAIYVGYKLISMLNVEYEYILTNGEMDIDIITAKSNRKRLVTFNCKDIDRIEKFSESSPMFTSDRYAKKTVYCNLGQEDIYCLSFNSKKIGKVCLVMQLNKKMREAMIETMDKLVIRDWLKESE